MKSSHSIAQSPIKVVISALSLASAFLAFSLITFPAQAGSDSMPSETAAAPAGGPDSVAFAHNLWHALEKKGLVGKGAIMATPYEGLEPHGLILETLDSKISLGARTGTVIVKRNYGPPGTTPEQVVNNPSAYLDAITVMFKREAGYDPENKDWFWAKYLPDGTLDKNPKGVKLAGRVMKGADKGCIACHAGAPGDDMVFNRDR